MSSCRLRASVEELVQQSAMVSGVAHAAAAERPRRSSSRGLESETTHLTMRPAEALPDVGEPAGAEAPVRRQPCPFPVLALTPCLCCSRGASLLGRTRGLSSPTPCARASSARVFAGAQMYSFVALQAAPCCSRPT